MRAIIRPSNLIDHTQPRLDACCRPVDDGIFLTMQGGVIGFAIVHSKVIVIAPFTSPVVITGSPSAVAITRLAQARTLPSAWATLTRDIRQAGTAAARRPTTSAMLACMRSVPGDTLKPSTRLPTDDTNRAEAG